MGGLLAVVIMNMNEPLRGKKITIAEEIYNEKTGKYDIKFVPVFSAKDVKSACEFYLKFRSDPSVFFAIHPQYYDDFEKECGSLSENLEDTACFDKWLFKLAFKDVFEEVKENEP